MRLLSFAIALALPLASAGTPDDPEIDDPVGDTAAFPSPNPAAAAALDIEAVWVTNATETFTVHWQIADLRPAQQADRFEYGLDWTLPDARGHAEIWRQRGDEVVDAGLWLDRDEGVTRPCAHTNFDALKATLHVDDAADTMSLTLPTSCLVAEGSNVVLEGLNAYTFYCVMMHGNRCVTEASVDTATAKRDPAFGNKGSADEGSVQPVVAAAESPGTSLVVGLLLLPAMTFLRRRRPVANGRSDAS